MNTAADHSNHMQIHGLPERVYGIAGYPETHDDDGMASVRRTYEGTVSRNVARHRPLQSRQFNNQSIASHKLVDLGLDVYHGPLGQMHIDKGGGNPLVAK